MSSVYPKRLIEVDLPIKRISAHARREKSIRHGHISTLHIWWARRPLAACRAVICASLWPDPADELCPQAFRDKALESIKAFAQKVVVDPKLAASCHPETMGKYLAIAGRVNSDAGKPGKDGKREQMPTPELNSTDPTHLNILRYLLLDFIADFADWDNSAVKDYLNTSRALTQVAHEALGGMPDTKPLVADPFAGGGALPLEALRSGATAFAGDLNPLAALLNKVALEYAPRNGLRLAEEVRRWGDMLRDQVTGVMQEFYPAHDDASTPIGYLWARTVRCEGPGCGVEVPIIKNLRVCDRRHQEVAIAVSYESKKNLRTHLITGEDARGVAGGTSKRSSVTCPLCGYTTPRKSLERQAVGVGFGYHLLAVCLRSPDGERVYRQPLGRDVRALERADAALSVWQTADFAGIPAVPHEELPYLRSIFNVRVYGIDQWSKLFHRRQLLSVLTFTKVFRELAEHIRNSYPDISFGTAVMECLALSVSNSFQYQCNIATYLSEGVKSAFIQGQSLPMKMDFIEANPLMDTLAGGYAYSLEQHCSALEYLASFEYEAGTAQQVSALDRPLAEDSVELVATDPPYYDVVPYADCSDFFYVWLRRMLHGYTDFPASDFLAPKDQEIVQLAERNERYRLRTKKWFEDRMRDALENARLSLKPSGIAVIVFAHKETSAWEALLQAVLDAGWIVCASWPIDTEKSTRLRANNSAVLASSIHLVCRPREDDHGMIASTDVGDWRDVLHELPIRIHEWMPRLAREGVVGADAIFACLGPALEIFSRYSQVEKASGEHVTLRECLEEVWAVVSREALNMIFKGADATGFEEDARITAMWLWTLSTEANDNGSANGTNGGLTEQDSSEEDEESSSQKQVGGFTLEYDAARKIAQGLGCAIENLTDVVEIKGETARLLPVSDRAARLFGKDELNPARQRKKRDDQLKLDGMLEIEEESDVSVGLMAMKSGKTTLDRIHQSMLLFSAGRSDALQRFLVDDGIGRDQRLWKLAQALSALYPKESDEKRWVDGVLARKKGLGF